MKLFTTIFLLIYSFQNIYSQVEWNKYEEPSGVFKRLSINPSFTFNTDYDGRFTDIDTDFSADAIYTSRKVDTLSILNTFSNSFIGFGLTKINDNDARNFAIFNPSINVNFDKYLKKRRGIFISGNLSSRLDLQFRTNSKNQYNDFTSIKIGIGTGRIENVSTLYQAIRVNNQLNSGSLLSQDQLFSLADKIRTFDYNTTLDSRMARVENTTNYLNQLRDLGYQLISFQEISNAIDAFQFERPTFIGSGSRFLFDINYFFSLDNDISDYSFGLNYEYQKPINKNWHWSNSFISNYQLSSDFLLVTNSTAINYFPSGRTQITMTQNIFYNKGFSFFSSSSLNYSLNTSINYFVSPTVSIFGNFSYNFNDITNSQRYTNSLNNNIGFRKFLI